MSINGLVQNLKTLNIFPNAGGKPEDYPLFVHELVSEYIEAWSEKDQPKLDAFKILEVNKKLPAIDCLKVKLEIRMSTIPNAGLGIFAADTIPKGKVIGSYGGPLPILNTKVLNELINLGEGALSRSDYEEESKLSEKQRNYTMKIPVQNDEMDEVDYFCVYPTEEQLIKHEKLVSEYIECKKEEMCREHLKQIRKNMNWTALINDACDPFRNNVKVIENGYLNTDKEIQAGEELFLEYGSEYWEDEKPYVTLDVFNTIVKNCYKIREELKRVNAERAGLEKYPICISSDSEQDPDSMPPFPKRQKPDDDHQLQNTIFNYLRPNDTS